MKTPSTHEQMQHALHGVCKLVQDWAATAAASIEVATLFATKINRSWAPGGLLREEIS